VDIVVRSVSRDRDLFRAAYARLLNQKIQGSLRMNNHSGNKVLIVDDEPAIRLVVGEALRGWGYETVEAGTGAEALSTLDAIHPAAVLLDINLPDSCESGGVYF
jgi:PleD family two-component response regulator